MLTQPPDCLAADLTGRWELLRALGALAIGPPSDAQRAAGALGLAALTAAEHTNVFVLSLPPYASIHLGADGMLGGEAADRVAGFWRALGLSPPPDADHLAAILALYAELGEAAVTTRRRGVRERLTRAREAVLWEHLWSWVGRAHTTSPVGGGARQPPAGTTAARAPGRSGAADRRPVPRRPA
jgi:TorA maturation chaperone TorD